MSGPRAVFASVRAVAPARPAFVLAVRALVLAFAMMPRLCECGPADAPTPSLGRASEVSSSLPVPPLGLDDATRLLMHARSLLDAPSSPSLSGAREAGRLAGACADYMDAIAQAQRGRIAYEWRAIGKRKRVASGPATVREFNVVSRVEGASALRLQAFYGDVFAEQLVVQDASGESLTIRLERWVRADLSQGPDTVFLDSPLTISRIYASCRHDGSRPPRLGIEAGIPRRPEYAREIAFLSRRAAGAIEREDWTESRETLTRALRRLAQFRAQRGAE